MYFDPHTDVWNSPWSESAGKVVQLLPGIIVAPALYHQDQQPLVEQSGTIGWPSSNMFWEEQVTPNRRRVANLVLLAQAKTSKNHRSHLFF